MLEGLGTPPDTPASADAAQQNAAIKQITFTREDFIDALMNKDDKIARHETTQHRK